MCRRVGRNGWCLLVGWEEVSFVRWTGLDGGCPQWVDEARRGERENHGDGVDGDCPDITPVEVVPVLAL